MYPPEVLLSATLRRLRTQKALKAMCQDRIFFQEIKFNGSPEHFLKRCEDAGIRKLYSPVCEQIAKEFFQLNLPYQKGFAFIGTTQNFQPLFKNTTFPQGFRCEDSVLWWDIADVKKHYDFYKTLG